LFSVSTATPEALPDKETNDLIRCTENQNLSSANIMLTFTNDLRLIQYLTRHDFKFPLTVLFFYGNCTNITNVCKKQCQLKFKD